MTLEDLIRTTLALDPSLELKDADGPGSLDGWDSLGHIRLLAAIEKHYHVVLQPEEVAGVATLADLKDLLRRKGVEGG